jgi:16S rRNA (guanine527-N7)-methyltransferase
MVLDQKQLLIKGAAEMGVDLTLLQAEQLMLYINEFEKWNKAYNLSAVRELEQMIGRHLLDSLSVVPWLREKIGLQEKLGQNPEWQSIIDVGTGGGLPGIPLSIMFPQINWTLLDSNGKKMRFLFHIKTLLKLDNVSVENRRVESFQPEKKFDAVISRAFASLQDMTEGCSHLLKPEGIFLAMKGLFPQDEMEPIKNKIDLLETIKLKVAATEGERHLLVLQLK